MHSGLQVFRLVCIRDEEGRMITTSYRSGDVALEDAALFRGFSRREVVAAVE